MIKLCFKTIICAVLAILSLSQCTTLSERNVKINSRQVEHKLNQKITSPILVMRVFQLQLSNAIVALNQKEGRIHAMMDTRLTGPLINQEVLGKLHISGQLKLISAENAIVLENPAIESVEWQGLTAEYTDILNQVAKSIGKKWLNGITLYQAKPEDLTYAGQKYKPMKLLITDDALQLTLIPSTD